MCNPMILAALGTNDTIVIVLGLGTVFVGLISLIILCKILAACLNLLSDKNSKTQSNVVAVAPVNSPTTAPAVIANRREVVAAIAAAIAEEEDTDVSAIRILSIQQL